jgi:hypothetical protein
MDEAGFRGTTAFPYGRVKSCSAFIKKERGATAFQKWPKNLVNNLVHPAEARAGVEKGGPADSTWSRVTRLRNGSRAYRPPGDDRVEMVV